MTLEQLIKTNDAPAIAALQRPPLSHSGLRLLVQRTRQQLNNIGIGRGDRVALVLPNGPEAAAAFVAIAATAAVAPLNPGYRADEIVFAVQDIGAKAIVLAADEFGAPVAAAERLNLPVIRLQTEAGTAAGEFWLSGPTVQTVSPQGPCDESDIALLLHTSGTTSRPKLVPLTHGNLAASALTVAAVLGLTDEDRCLNIMPLFHIHGLVAALLASLASGGCIVCSPGFNALKFFQWLSAVRPTWYTAVPTMHQAILSRSLHNREALADVPLRLIRSSSAPLLPRVMQELESTFGCPAVEAYGMTEASHQISSNLLPPGERRPGWVGRSAGPDVAIMNEAGELLEPGELGEIVIKGPSVTTGYERNPEANSAAFVNGWFRTGDQGVMDEVGCLRITGRLKEMINRGGEKISPLEIDQVILDHPSVAQVVTFGIPHEILGEEVGAAIVLREGQTETEQSIRAFAATKVAAFKVPRRVVILDEIPTGATGKLQRIGLATRLGLG